MYYVTIIEVWFSKDTRILILTTFILGVKSGNLVLCRHYQKKLMLIVFCCLTTIEAQFSKNIEISTVLTCIYIFIMFKCLNIHCLLSIKTQIFWNSHMFKGKSRHIFCLRKLFWTYRPPYNSLSPKKVEDPWFMGWSSLNCIW